MPHHKLNKRKLARLIKMCKARNAKKVKKCSSEPVQDNYIWRINKTYSVLARDENSKELEIEAFAYLDEHDEPMPREPTLRDMGYAYENIDIWEEVHKMSPEGKSKLIQYIIEYQEEPDIVIMVEGTMYFCHLLALRCYTDFFDNYIYKAVYKLNLTKDIFLRILDWMYAKKPVLEAKQIGDFIMAADYLRIPELVRQCLTFYELNSKRTIKLREKRKLLGLYDEYY